MKQSPGHNNNGHTSQPPCLQPNHVIASPHVIASAAKQSPENSNTCLYCGSVGTVELVKWNDKTTGQPRQAPKCQSCGKWVR